MSKEHPTPWKFDINDADEPIKDANGERVFATDDGFLGPDDDTIREIVDAVNDRDRLRDIVRRLIPLAETTVENIRALGTARFPFLEQIKSDRLRGDINREVANADHLLREARAALAEEQQ